MLKKLKDSLDAAADMLLNLVSAIAKLTVRAAFASVLALSILIAAAKAPELHGQWVRHQLKDKIYMIKDVPRGGGGTGFAVRAPSGKDYILTNDHVCGVSKDGRSVLVQTDDNHFIRRNIISRSDKTDLCLIEGIPGVVGMRIGPEPSAGQIVASVGHPLLMPLTVSRGEVIGQEDVRILEGFIDVTTPDGISVLQDMVPPEKRVEADKCKLAKNLVDEADVMTMFGPLHIKACLVVTKAAYVTTAIILPGNSGSPVIDFWGRVVGVIFASDQSNWGRAVSHDDVVDMLKMY